MRIYVNSYGGSGSWLLVKYLKSVGVDCYHVHARKAPSQFVDLCTSNSCKSERLDFGKKIGGGKFIFLYRKPIYSLLSRKSSSVTHFENIDVKASHIKKLLTYGFNREPMQDIDGLKRYLSAAEDLISYSQIYNNFHNCRVNRNYEIMSLKFDDMWGLESEICRFCGVESSLKLAKREPRDYDDELIRRSTGMFSQLNSQIDAAPPLKIIPENPGFLRRLYRKLT